MRVRFPLSARILAWFFLNLALLGVIAFLVLQQRTRFGLDSLVAGPAGDRLRAMAILVADELRTAPREGWDEILARIGREHGVRLSLFAERGAQLAGAPTVLPPRVVDRLPREGPRHRRPPPPGRDGPRFPPPPGPRDDDDHRPPPPRPEVMGLERAGTPPHYYALIHAPLPRFGPEGPSILVLESDSLAAGGLIFDLRPLLWAVAVVVIFSVLFWLPLIRGITRSIAAMQSATARIAEGRFETEVDVSRRDELGALGASINRMSERIAGLVNGQRRFLSDVAHELCAPLSRLQMALGILEARAASPGPEQLQDVREEVDQIAALVNELLSFSRASLGAKQVDLRAVELLPLMEQAAQREAGGAVVNLDCAAGLFALADRDLLLRAVSNLVRNAVSHAGGSGPVEFTAQRDGAQVLITVTDHGPGIPTEALPHIFDPFYRLDPSRTRATGGVGLGLTITKSCVEACGGTIALTNVEPHGLRATILLAAASAFAETAAAPKLGA